MRPEATGDARRSPAITRILLAVDRSREALKARDITAKLASGLPASVQVLHVHETPLTASIYDPETLRREGVETAAQASLLVERTVASLRYRGIDASGIVRPSRGSTVGQIVAAARETKADLLVMGALGVSHLRELLVGGVAHATVQLAPCPVLIVPRGRRSGDLRRVAVGVDGSACSARAVELTSELVQRLHGSALVVHVKDGSLAENEPDRIAAAAAAAIGPDHIAAVRVRATGEAGIAAALQAEALDYGAGLLVVGRRGRGPLQRLLLGGVSERLLHIAPCPLLVAVSPMRSRLVRRPSAGERTR